MCFSDLEHPSITNACQTGYPDGQNHEPYCFCDRCRKEIYLGEKYLDLDGQFLCDDCLSESVHVAGEEDE